MTHALSRLLRPVLVAAAVTALGGCVVVSKSGPGPSRASAAAVLSPGGVVLQPTVVLVGVSAAGTPVVTQEPVVIAGAARGQPITWRLPEGSGLGFAENGIVIEGQFTRPTDAEWRRFGETGKPEQYQVVLDKKQSVIGGCRRVSPLEFTCANAGTPGRFAYTVRLLRDGKPIEPLDPTIVNLP